MYCFVSLCIYILDNFSYVVKRENYELKKKKRKMKSWYLRRTENETKTSPNQNLIDFIFKGVLVLSDYCI